MAWLSDLAGRAENMLNKLDQNAATVLVQPSIPSTSSSAAQLLEVVSADSEAEHPRTVATPKKTATADQHSGKLDDFVVSAIEQEIANSDQALTVDQELAATKIVLQNTKQDRDALKAEVSSLVEQIHHRNNGRSRVTELERSVTDLEEKNRQLSWQAGDQMKVISDLQISGAQVKQSLADAQEQLQVHKVETERAVQELANYRNRAQGLLQIKEQLIEDLRTGAAAKEDTSSVDVDVAQTELERLRNENKIQLADLAEMQMRLKESQEQQDLLAEKLTRAGQEVSAAQEKLRSAVQGFDNERSSLRQEVSILRTELQAVRIQHNQSNEKLIQQLHEKEQVIAGLRKRTNAPQNAVDSLDNRIKSLTQSLIQKQTSLEEATANRNALKIQLEKVEAQYRSAQARLRSEASEVYSPNHSMLTDDDKAQLPAFMQENPFDNQMAKRMKRVIKASDSFLDRFLRRYPLLRVFLFFYVLLLHIWVMIVLMSSTPN